MNEKEPDERLARAAQRLLRRSADELDAATLARLKRARQNALAGLDGGGWGRLRFGAWRPAVGVAALCATALIAVGLWFGQAGGPHLPGESLPVSAQADSPGDLEVMLADQENLDMIEDLEFYNWVEPDPAVPDDPGRSG